MSLLVVENIVKEYRNRTVLNGVSLRIEKGERVALTGPNGSGKSTLLKIAVKDETCDRGNVVIARNIKVGYISQSMIDIGIKGENPNSTALCYEKVNRIEQKLRKMENELASLSEKSDEAEYNNLMSKYSKMINQYESIDGYNVEAKIKKILLGLGLRKEALTTPVSKLSGGEKMRVAIARVLIEEPDLLILDEPTNHLDIQATEWLEEFLKKFEGGVLIVSHDRYFLDQVATRVAELESGGITMRSGNYSTFIEQKSVLREYILKEQKRLKRSIKQNNQLIQELKSKGKHKAAQSREILGNRKRRQGINKMSGIKEKEHLYGNKAPKISFKEIKKVSKDIAWAEGLKKNFGSLNIFSGADFHIRGGECIGIIGPNGCGKTTLINILLGNDEDYGGTVKLGKWVKYSYMGQEIIFHNEEMTILQEVLSKKDMLESAARDHLSKFQFYGDQVDKKIKVLSGGERVRLFLACIILDDSNCLIMDEPTNHLDLAARNAIETALKEFKGTVIAITHDRYFLNNCVGRILEIDGGKINSYNGNYEFYKAQKLREAEEINEKKSRVSSTKEKNPSKNSINKKSSKKNNSYKTKKRVIEQKEIEQKITNVESKIKELEASFDKTTSIEKYREYDDLTTEINNLYSQWEELIG